MPELPDLFRFDDGRRLTDPVDWPARRREILELVVDVEYGRLPPVPAGLTAQPLHTTRPRRLPESTYTQYRVVLDDHPAFHFRLDVLVPEGDGPFPVVLTGDGCWLYADDAVRREALERGFILAVFSRTAIVPDIYTNNRDTGLYLLYPQADFGALAAWAWGYHRAIDVLLTLPQVDPAGITIIGHSRGGKTTLLAGATDERITVTGANCSGCGGAGSHLVLGPDCETLADMKRMIPYWYGPRIWDYLGRTEQLPFDQHFLKAAVAPRAFMSNEALSDLWANPRGTWATHVAARDLYEFLGIPERCGIHYREGGHDHTVDDWKVFLDFAEWHLRNQPPPRPYNRNPFAAG